MSARRSSLPSRLALPVLGVVLLAAGVIYTVRAPSPDDGSGLPTDCGVTPSAYHPGTIVDWPASRSAGPKPSQSASAELFARVRFDSGRMVLAYNSTPTHPDAGARVVVAEIRCVHRTIHLLTELGAPAAPADGAQPPSRGH